jgi:hypothetical protein
MPVLASALIISDFVQDLGPGQKKNILGVAGAVRAGAVPTIVGSLWFYWRAYLEFDRPSTHSFVIQVRTGEAVQQLGGGTMEPADTTDQSGAGHIELFHPVPPFQVQDYGIVKIEILLDGELCGAAVLEIVPPEGLQPPAPVKGEQT